MLKNKIETRGVRNWNYERFNFQSTILNQEVQCGLLRPDSKAEIQRTFYILHGGDGDDTQAVQAGLLPVLDDILTQGSHKHVQIVFPYIGSSFLHNPPSLTSKSFSSYFLNEILPACEAGTTTQDRSRYLCGWSMGGQAALSMFIRAMDLFGGVGVHFPTLINFNYNDKGQQAAYALRQKVSHDMLSLLVESFQKEFSDLKDFSNHDPLVLAPAKTSAQWFGKKIYFDVGGQDEFGLSEGVTAFHEILQQKNVPHHFELIAEGKHNAPFIHAQIKKMLNYLL